MKNGTTISLQELIALRFQAKKLSLLQHRRRIANKSTHAGENSALAFGRGLEFAEVREYQHGDDIRTMDWRVTARTGKPHTKLYQEERERPLFLVVDYGESMFFGTRVAFKSVIAAQVAALISWAAMEERHRIGSLIFSGNQRIETSPKSGQQGVLSLLKILVDMTSANSRHCAGASEGPAMTNAFLRLQRLAKPGSTIILVSDFSDFDKASENYLSQLSLHCKVIVIFIYDPLEKKLPQEQPYPFTNAAKQFAMLDCEDLKVQKKYTEQFQERETYLKKRFSQWRMRFIPLATNDVVVDILSREMSGILK